MRKAYIGIDPGSKGFVAVDYVDGRRGWCALSENGWGDVAEFLKGVKAAADGDCVCCMEEIHAVYGSSAKATFSFGECFGVLQGLLVGLGIAYHLVPPKTWQKEIWVAQDKVYKSGGGKRAVDNKATSMRAAQRLLPGVDLRRNVKCRNMDDNKCDAALICEYGRRKNL